VPAETEVVVTGQTVESTVVTSVMVVSEGTQMVVGVAVTTWVIVEVIGTDRVDQVEYVLV